MAIRDFLKRLWDRIRHPSSKHPKRSNPVFRRRSPSPNSKEALKAIAQAHAEALSRLPTINVQSPTPGPSKLSNRGHPVGQNRKVLNALKREERLQNQKRSLDKRRSDDHFGDELHGTELYKRKLKRASANSDGEDRDLTFRDSKATNESSTRWMREHEWNRENTMRRWRKWKEELEEEKRRFAKDKRPVREPGTAWRISIPFNG